MQLGKAMLTSGLICTGCGLAKGLCAVFKTEATKAE